MKFELLLNSIRQTDELLRAKSAATINKYLTLRNWLIGAYIVEFEQKGEDRAAYGSELLKQLSDKLHKQGLSGFSERNLKLFRQFYQSFPEIRQTVSAELSSVSLPSIGQTVSAESESKTLVNPHLMLDHFSFSHFIELAKLESTEKRMFYAVECLKGTWSVRDLKRQINTLTYERSGMSKDPKQVMDLAQATTTKPTAQELIKNPFVVEFLGLPEKDAVSETDLEQALLDHIQEFLLELGHGFCFEARQKRIVIGDEYFFVDLVFYHRILKCHVLVELKVDEFSHTHAGQLNTYINYYRKNMMAEEDQPPIGILFCTNKNEALVEYATGNMDENLFVSEYRVELPDENKMRSWLEKDMENVKQHLEH